MRRWLVPAIFAIAVAVAAGAALVANRAHADTLARVEHMTPESRPYVKAPLPAGYTEDEVAVETLVSSGGQFRTVLDIRRPADPKAASGVVIVEPWHPGDLWPVQSTAQAYLARSGIVSIVVATSPTVQKILQRADPKRYADVDIAEGTETEILTQTVYLLKNGSIPGVKARKVILAGYSNTAAVVRAYLAAAYPEGQLPNKRLYDGYLVGQTAVGTKPVAIRDVGVPVIEIEGESELIRTFARGGDAVGYRRDDSATYRLYEVPGLSHLASRDEGQGDPIRWRCVHPERSQYPHRETWSAIVNLLVRWVADGKAAPHAPRIETTDGGRTIQRDAFGNAKGGVRSTVLEAPVAAIMPVGENAPADPKAARCDMVGWQTPLSPAQLAGLYADHAAYAKKVDASAAALVQAGWLLPEDAERLRAEAKAARVP
jgi:hypothetical protein